MGANRELSISARLPEQTERSGVAVQLSGREIRLIASNSGEEGEAGLEALQSVVSKLQADLDRHRRQRGATAAEGGKRTGDTRILLGRSAIPDPSALGGREPVTRYAVPLKEEQTMATAALEFYDDERRSVVVGFVLPGPTGAAGDRVTLRWGLRDEILQELHEHLGRRFRQA